MACQSCNVFHRRREEVTLRKLFLRSAFLERLLRAEYDPFETTFWSLGKLRLLALHGVVSRGYISWTIKDQNEGVPLSRVEIFSALRRSAQELLKASVDDAKGPPIVASQNS